MFLVHRPTEEEIRRFLASQQHHPFSYPDPGITGLTPHGYTMDHSRIRLGNGEEVFQRAIEALKRWEMFNIGWVQLCWPDTPIQTGATVGVLAHQFGFWSLNACRIANVIEEDGEVRRSGFAYGTLPEHVERGQESFTIELQAKDDSVWYDILAYSTPNHLLAKLGYPITRALQKRFVRDSMKAMRRAV
ncbi:MAG: DUF1990 domain-containing protein [Acidobacteriota bacterium]